MIFYDCLTAPSPRRTRILLHEKNVPHEVINIDLMKGEQLSPSYKSINPTCTVPALKLDNGTVLTETAGIAAYLESAYPSPPMLGSTDIEKGLIAKRGMERVSVFFETLNQRLEDRDFVAIDSFSNADISAVIAVDFAHAIKLDPQPHHENIIRWRQSLASRPSLSI